MQSRLFAKKVINLQLFLIIRRKCVKMGAQMGGEISPKIDFFLIGPPLGAPGFIFLDFWAPWTSFWHFLSCPWYHFGTLGPHQNDAPAV